MSTQSHMSRPATTPTVWRVRTMMIQVPLLALLLSACACCLAEPESTTSATTQSPAVSSVDLYNLDECVPMRLEDALVRPEGSIEVLTCMTWGHSLCENLLQGKVAVAAGLSNRTEAVVGTKFRDSDNDALGSGDIFLRVLRQVDSIADRDAAAVGVEVNFPAGQDHSRVDRTFPPFAFPVNQRRERIDVSLLGSYTRVLDPEDGERVHLKVRHTLVNSAPVGFRGSRLFAATGYDRPLGENLLGMASIWWEQSADIFHEPSAAMQLGVRHKINDRLLVAGSLNLGMGWREADWGFTLAATYHLSPASRASNVRN